MPMARCLLRAAALAALVGGVYAPTGQTFASTQAQLDCLQLGRGREFTCDDPASCATGTCEDCPVGKFDHDAMDAMSNMFFVGGTATYWDGASNDYNAVRTCPPRRAPRPLPALARRAAPG